MPEPLLEPPWGTQLTIARSPGERIGATLRNWLLTVPSANPALLQMFRDRDRSDRPPPSDRLLPWSGEFAGKYLISGAQFLRLTADPDLRATLQAFVSDLISCQDSDGYLGPF